MSSSSRPACRSPPSSPAAPRAFEVSEVRPQVSGVIRAPLFTEGSIVRAGPDALPDRPEPLSGRASPRRRPTSPAPQANREAARRPRPPATSRSPTMRGGQPAGLYRRRAPRRGQAAAAVAQNRAALETAQINLRFTRVPAPISGRIGRSLVTTGALVTANQADPLDHDPAARPDLRRHPAVERRAARAAPRARQPAASTPAAAAVRLHARGRQRLRPRRHGRVRRGGGRSEHRHGDAARHASPIRRACCCPACTSARASPRRPAPTPSWCRSRRVARSAGQCDGDGGRPRQQGACCAPGQGRPHGRRQMAGHRRPQAGRQGDRRGPRQGQAAARRCRPVPAGSPPARSAAGSGAGGGGPAAAAAARPAGGAEAAR